MSYSFTWSHCPSSCYMMISCHPSSVVSMGFFDCDYALFANRATILPMVGFVGRDVADLSDLMLVLHWVREAVTALSMLRFRSIGLCPTVRL